MKLNEILSEGTTLNFAKLTKCITKLATANRDKWADFTTTSSDDTMCANGLCGLWVHFAVLIDPSLEMWVNDVHAWVKDSTGKFYDSGTPQGVDDWRKLPTHVELEKEGHNLEDDWLEGSPTGYAYSPHEAGAPNFEYPLTQEEQQAVLRCYSG